LFWFTLLTRNFERLTLQNLINHNRRPLAILNLCYFRNYRNMLDSIYNLVPEVNIIIMEVLPREWDSDKDAEGNQHLEKSRRNIIALNQQLESLAFSYTTPHQTCRYILQSWQHQFFKKININKLISNLVLSIPRTM